MDADRFFLKLAKETDVSDPENQLAPPKLKSRIYSTLITHLAATGPLLSLSQTKKSGRSLCVFEAAMTVVPAGEQIGPANACRVCHARFLAEHLESAPIFWPHCPYAQFHHR